MVTEYSFIDKVFHRVALNRTYIRKVLFDFDGFFSGDSEQNINATHVFISGLARAGTTILMRAFYNTGVFRSLTYRDMPFILMPIFWKSMSKSFYKYEEPKARSHGDGIMVDFDSPEAFEEVFWKTFCFEDYISCNGLLPHIVNDETIEKFRKYVSRIIASSDNPNHELYLSKNNNNILRLKYIRKAFPQSLIIIPFRDPIQQAISLYNQHLKFCLIHNNDKFALKYFNWLGHYEFGGGHLPFLFNNNVNPTESNYKPDNINYWLNCWVNTYAYLSNNAPEDTVFICYEGLCNNPEKSLSRIFSSVGLVVGNYNLNQHFTLSPKKNIVNVSEELVRKSAQIYQYLLAKENNH